MFRPNDIVYTADERMARVMRLIETRRGTEAALWRYPGKRPMSSRPIAELQPTSLLTFMFDANDLARLRELRRLTFAANATGEASQCRWGPRNTSLAGHARFSIDLLYGLWKDDSEMWNEALDDALYQCRRVAPRGATEPFRLRMSVAARDRLFRFSDETRYTIDDLLRATVAQQVEVLCDDGAPTDALRKELRLCVYPPAVERYAARALKEQTRRRRSRKVKANTASVAGTPPQVEAVPLSVLGGSWLEDGDGVRCAASASLLPTAGS